MPTENESEKLIEAIQSAKKPAPNLNDPERIGADYGIRQMATEILAVVERKSLPLGWHQLHLIKEAAKGRSVLVSVAELVQATYKEWNVYEEYWGKTK